MDTGYETLAPGVAGCLCVKCREIKPMPQFKRVLTKLQARARGYTGNRPVEIDSSICKACRPRKAEADLTIRELRNRVYNGDIHPVIAKDKIAKRKKQVAYVRSKAARARWSAERDLIWRPIHEALHAEITKAIQQAKHLKRKPRATPAVALLAFLTEHYLPALRTIRASIDVIRYTKEKSAPHADWQSYADATAVKALHNAWEAVPLDERTAVRKPPALIVWRADMAQPAPSPPRRSHLDASDRPAELPSERRRRERWENWRAPQ